MRITSPSTNAPAAGVLGGLMPTDQPTKAPLADRATQQPPDTTRHQ